MRRAQREDNGYHAGHAIGETLVCASAAAAAWGWRMPELTSWSMRSLAATTLYVNHPWDIATLELGRCPSFKDDTIPIRFSQDIAMSMLMFYRRWGFKLLRRWDITASTFGNSISPETDVADSHDQNHFANHGLINVQKRILRKKR